MSLRDRRGTSLCRARSVAAGSLRLWMLRASLYAGELDTCQQGIAELAPRLPPERVHEAFALTLLEAFLAVHTGAFPLAFAVPSREFENLRNEVDDLGLLAPRQ